MDPKGSHSAINWEVGGNNWIFNSMLAPQTLCWGWREGRKIHSGATGSSPEPWDVTRYLLVSSQLSTAHSSLRDAHIGGLEERGVSWMLTWIKILPSLVAFVFFGSFSTGFLLRFFSSKRRTGLERFQPFSSAPNRNVAASIVSM